MMNYLLETAKNLGDDEGYSNSSQVEKYFHVNNQVKSSRVMTSIYTMNPEIH